MCFDWSICLTVHDSPICSSISRPTPKQHFILFLKEVSILLVYIPLKILIPKHTVTLASVAFYSKGTTTTCLSRVATVSWCRLEIRIRRAMCMTFSLLDPAR